MLLVIDQSPLLSTIAVPSALSLPSYKVTLEPISAIPSMVGVGSLVVPDEIVMLGAVGAVVSPVIVKSDVALLALPAASVSTTLKL